MKKVLRIACSFAGAALLFASCQKEAVDKTDPKISDGEVLITVNASEGAETKTYIDGTAVKWADSGEFIRVYEVATPKGEGNDVITSANDSAEGATIDEGASMTFGVSLDAKSTEDYSSFAYYAFYPASAHASSSSAARADKVLINTTANQKPTATSFDPKADLLIAEKQTANSQPITLNMKFARGVAVAKMTIKNLETDDPVTKVTFSAKLGSEPINLAGRTAFDLTTDTPTLVSTFASNVAETSIVIDCANITQAANTADGTPIFFTSYPFVLNSTTPGSFKVVVETATQSFEKEITVGSGANSDRSLIFKTGKASVFSVDMDNIDGDDKSVDLCYASLSYDDYVDAGGTNSYSNKTVYKSAHGDAWVTYACVSNGAIGVRRNDQDKNDSFIQLPIFTENIKTVVVTLKSPTAGKTITLETSATGTEGTIASLTTTDATEYTFDLTSKSVKTAYYRSNGFQSLVEKIEVLAGEDTRSAFNAPASVTATLNDDDADVTNSIDVSWEAVENASGYVITLSPGTGDDVVVNAASSPVTVTDLQYDMDYLVAVQAEPNDYYVNTISGQTMFNGEVTTGEQPAQTVKYTKVTTAPGNGDWSGIYLIVGGSKVSTGVVTNNWLTLADVTISEDEITQTTALQAYEAIIEKVAGQSYYTIKYSAGYLGTSNSNNGINTATNAGANYYWNFSVSEGLVKISSNAFSSRYLQFVSSGGRTYTSAQNGGSQATLYKLDDGKSNAEISYARSSDTITYSDALTAPALSNAHSLAITCETDNDAVATVSATTGVISVVGNAGTATITVSWDEQTIGGVTYREGSATYTLTINKKTPTIAAFDAPTTSVAVGSTVTNTTTITDGLTIIYTSNKADVATVNASTGEVEGVADGTAVISATFAGNDNYNAAESKTYTITVGAGSSTPDPVDVTMQYTGSTTTNMTGNNDAATVGLDADKWSVVAAKGGQSNFPGLNSAGDIRLYYNATESNSITVTTLETGATINNITITYTGDTYSNGKVLVGGSEVSISEGSYPINNTSFVITNGNTSNVQVRISSIVINYTPAN